LVIQKNYKVGFSTPHEPTKKTFRVEKFARLQSNSYITKTPWTQDMVPLCWEF